MKWVNPAAYNLLLTYITTNTDQIYLCTSDIENPDGTPDYSKIVGASKVAGPLSVLPGDFTIADGDSGGRTLTIDGQSSITVTAAGFIDSLCLIYSGDPSDSGVLLVTDFSYGYVAINDVINFNDFDYDLPAPY